MTPKSAWDDEAFTWKPFGALSGADVYALLRLRQDVFVVEQDCVFPDIDGLDHAAEHLLVCDSTGTLVGYCRIFLAGVDGDVSQIGRVVTAESARGQGLGHLMMAKAIERCRDHSKCDIRIAAQSHLVPFYSRHGFRVCSDEYLEDGIPHTAMLLSYAVAE